MAAVLVMAMALTGCGGGESGGAPTEQTADDQGGAPVESEQQKSSEDEQKEEKAPADNTAKSGGKIELSKDGKVILLESGYSYDEEYGLISVGALIADTNSENAYDYPGISVTAYADDGSILATEEATMDSIQPGEKLPVVMSLDTKNKKPKKVEIKEVQGDEADPDSEAIKSSELVCSNITERFDKEYGELSYTGEVTNKSSRDSDEITLYVLLKNKGKIVWANEEFDAVTDLAKGEKKPFDMSFYPKAEYDSYEIYAVDISY